MEVPRLRAELSLFFFFKLKIMPILTGEVISFLIPPLHPSLEGVTADGCLLHGGTRHLKSFHRQLILDLPTNTAKNLAI